jgi:hypothetical protein
MINHKKDKSVGARTDREKDYLQKDKTASSLHTKMNQEEGENKRRKMMSRGFF